MALVSGQRSTLNPNAPLFVPAVYRQVEDFSPEWWELVKNSTWFRDYWMSLHPVEGDLDGGDNDDDEVAAEDLLPENFDLEAQFEEMVKLAEEEEKIEGIGKEAKPWDGGKMDFKTGPKLNVKTLLKDLNVPKSPKETSPMSPVGPAKYQMKAAQYASPRSAPRRIQQPR